MKALFWTRKRLVGVKFSYMNTKVLQWLIVLRVLFVDWGSKNSNRLPHASCNVRRVLKCDFNLKHAIVEKNKSV